MLIWALKQVEDFVFQFSINGSCLKYTKLLSLFYVIPFFISSGGVGEVLVTLPLIEQIIKDASSMCISFSVQYPQTF